MKKVIWTISAILISGILGGWIGYRYMDGFIALGLLVAIVVRIGIGIVENLK